MGEAYDKLSPKHKRFVDEYFIQNMNATRAYMEVYAPKKESSARASGSFLLKREDVIAAINDRMGSNQGKVSKKDPRVKKSKQKVVYLIRESWRGTVKIGISNDINKRMETLQVGSPQELELVGYIQTEHPIKTERDLHKRFAHKHHRGEWYNLTEDDITLILEYHNGHTPVKMESLKQMRLFTDG